MTSNLECYLLHRDNFRYSPCSLSTDLLYWTLFRSNQSRASEIRSLSASGSIRLYHEAPDLPIFQMRKRVSLSRIVSGVEGECIPMLIAFTNNTARQSAYQREKENNSKAQCSQETSFRMRTTYFRMPSQLCYTVDVNQYQHDIVSKCIFPWMYGESNSQLSVKFLSET